MVKVSVVILALGIVWAYGRVLVALLPSSVGMSRLEKAGLSWLAGTSYLGFWTQMVILVTGTITRFAWIASAIPIIAAFWFAFHRHARVPRERRETDPPGLAAVLATLVLITVMGSLTIRSLNSGPGWDGIYNWGMKAKVLYLEGGPAHGSAFDYFQSPHWQFSHVKYPLTFPSVEAWLFTWLGGVDERLTMVLGPIFLTAGAAVLMGFLAPISGGLRAALLGTLLATVPLVVDMTATSYADIPFAMALLAAVAGCVRWLSDDRASYDCVVWIAVLPLIKLEGLFYAALLTAVTVLFAITRNRARSFRFLLWSALALMVSAAPWHLYLQSSAAVDGDFVKLNLQSLSAGLGRMPRLWDLAYSTISSPSNFGILPIVLPLAFFAGWQQLSKPGVIFVVVVLAAGSLFSTFIFIFSNWPDFYRHAYHTVDRLFLHLAPSAVLLMGLLLADFPPPAETAGVEKTASPG